MIPWLRRASDPLPDPSEALGPESEAPGLLAAGGRLDPARLEEAYRHGVFPWYGEGQPVLWWSPDPRMVLLPEEFRLARSLKKTIRRFLRTPGAELRVDFDCRAVLEACAGAARGRDAEHAGTWIVPEMIDAYAAWHRAGRVHSVETWQDGQLVGGLYGVSIGRMVFGESMFQRRTDASKIALAYLVAFCRARGVGTIDCQQQTEHLASFGGREIPRARFRARVDEALAHPDLERWSYDAAHWRRIDIDPGTEEPP